MSPTSATPNSSPTLQAAAPPRLLLPFFSANLLAVYLPGLLPTYVLLQDKWRDGPKFADLRLAIIEFLNAPYALLSQAVDGGIFMLAAHLGNLGSFYLFVLGLCLLILGATLLYCHDPHRYRLTFLLFVIFAGQAIFVARQLVVERQQAPAAVPELLEEPVLPGGRQPVQP